MNIREQEIEKQLKIIEEVIEKLKEFYPTQELANTLEEAVGMINSAVLDKDFEKYNSKEVVMDNLDERLIQAKKEFDNKKNEVVDQPVSDYDKIYDFCGRLETWVGRGTVEELRDILIQAEQDKDYMTTVTDAVCDYCKVEA